MLKLDTVPVSELKNKFSDSEFDDTIETITSEVEIKKARVLTSDTATGVIKILKDEKQKIEIFLTALTGKKGREYISELIDFAKFNKINFVGLQTRKQGALKVMLNRFDFKYLGNHDGFFQLRKEVLL